MAPKLGRAKSSRRNKKRRGNKSKRANRSKLTLCPECNSLFESPVVPVECPKFAGIPLETDVDIPKAVEFPTELLKIWCPALFKEEGSFKPKTGFVGIPNIGAIVSDTDSEVVGTYGSHRKLDTLFSKRVKVVPSPNVLPPTQAWGFQEFNDEMRRIGYGSCSEYESVNSA